ncbi:MAG: hypothetical protein ACK4ON_04565, partial [Bacteroidia bacterium]
MKQTFLATALLVFSLCTNAQKLGDFKLKGKKENTETSESSSGTTTTTVNVTPGASQWEMIEAFYNSGSKYFFTSTRADLNSFSKPEAADRKVIISALHKDESGKVIKFDTQLRGGSYVARGKAYPTYFQVNGEDKVFYFLGDIAIFIERVQSNADEPNGNQISSQSGDVAVISANKELVKNLKVEDVQKKITEYLTAAKPKLAEARQKMKEENREKLKNSAAKYECKNIKMNIEGDKIGEYVGDNDNKKREVFLAIKGDSIIYQVARSINGQMEMLKRWAVHIGIINQNDRYFMTHFFMNSGEKIYKAMFPDRKSTR